MNPPDLSSDPENKIVQRFSVGDIVRIPHYKTAGGFRVWKVTARKLGATYQEGTYSLKPLDVNENASVEVPCIILETHPGIEVC